MYPSFHVLRDADYMLSILTIFSNMDVLKEKENVVTDLQDEEEQEDVEEEDKVLIQVLETTIIELSSNNGSIICTDLEQVQKECDTLTDKDSFSFFQYICTKLPDFAKMFEFRTAQASFFPFFLEEFCTFRSKNDLCITVQMQTM